MASVSIGGRYVAEGKGRREQLDAMSATRERGRQVMVVGTRVARRIEESYTHRAMIAA